MVDNAPVKIYLTKLVFILLFEDILQIFVIENN